MKTKNVKLKTPKKKEEDLAELKGQLLRVQADFDNYRKRTQKEKEEFGSFLNTDLILRVIPVMDNFQLALKHLPTELEGNGWVSGIFHIERQLEQILADEGVQKIVAQGQRFNHHEHEAIEEIESGAPPETVVEEVMSGYKLKDKVIRPAKVKVSKGNNLAKKSKEKSYLTSEAIVDESTDSEVSKGEENE